MELNKTHIGDCMELSKQVPDDYVDLIVTSPPYWNQRDNGSESVVDWFDGSIGQLGQERNPQDYINKLVEIFNGEGRRCLKPGGQLWVNLGDTFSGGISRLPWGGKSPPSDAPIWADKK